MEPSDELKIKILAYLDGSIDESEKQSLMAELITQGIDAADLEQFASVLEKLDRVAAPEPSQDLDTKFYAMLHREEYRRQAGSLKGLTSSMDGLVQGLFWKRFAMATAAFLVLIVFGFMVYQGSTYRQEIASLNDDVKNVQTMLVMTLLEKESAVDRLRAVSLTSTLPSNDDAVIHALLTTLDNDPDVNVRLEAIDALVKRASDPRVRRGLVESIMRQSSPLVQASLADAMVAMQEKSSAPELKKLLGEKSTNDAVKTKLKESIEVLM
jgi:HEAT repeats